MSTDSEGSISEPKRRRSKLNKAQPHKRNRKIGEVKSERIVYS